MSEHYENHAKEVANAFLGMLDGQVRDGISEAHRNELAMLVEAAISTAVLEQLEHAVDEIDGLSKRLRNYAERYDKAPKNQ
jgi:hypothetical protein